MAPTSFTGLPAHERQAFFSLLDEYFASRPHLVPGSDGGGAEGGPSRSAAQPPAARKPAPTVSKPFGKIDIANAQNAFGSMVMGKPRDHAPGAAPSEAAAATAGQAEVLYDFSGAEAEDLAVKRFDIIDLVERISDDWWRARASDGRTGIVPANYIKEL